MLFLWFLLMVCTLAHGMEQEEDAFLLARRDIINVDVYSALWRIKPGLAVNTQDISGSYLLHWAVLRAMSGTQGADWRSTIDSRMLVVHELLRHGADYTLQERDSKRTIFHILAYLISPQSKERVSYAFNELLGCIVRKEISNQLTQDALVDKIQKVCARKDAYGSSVHDLVNKQKCMDLISAECIKNAYKLALAREVICY